MELQRIEQGLGRLFQTEGYRVVFWHDPEREFEETLQDLKLDGVSLLRLDEHPALAVKVRLEHEDPTGRYLLYAPCDPPAPDQDWLLDMRLTVRASARIGPRCRRQHGYWAAPGLPPPHRVAPPTPLA